MKDRSGSAFEVEAASVEEFLRLLSRREAAETPSRSPVRQAVFVTQLRDTRSSRYAFPKVTRHVVATFAYGPDIVSYRTTTSNAVELPEIATELAERQRQVCEQVWSEIERGIENADLGVPVREGLLRSPTDPRQEA